MVNKEETTIKIIKAIDITILLYNFFKFSAIICFSPPVSILCFTNIC